MRKIIITLVIIFAYTLAKSQDLEPSKYPFSYKGNSNYYISTDSSDFKQNRFLMGPIWSSDHRSNYALGLNSVLITTNLASATQPSNYAPGTDFMAQVSGLSHHYDPSPLITISFQYEPALKFNYDYLKTHDIDSAVFGFRYIDSNITINLT